MPDMRANGPGTTATKSRPPRATGTRANPTTAAEGRTAPSPTSGDPVPGMIRNAPPSFHSIVRWAIRKVFSIDSWIHGGFVSIVMSIFIMKVRKCKLFIEFS